MVYEKYICAKTRKIGARGKEKRRDEGDVYKKCEKNGRGVYQRK